MNNTSLIIIILLIITIIFSVFFWWPKYQEFNDLRYQLGIKEKALKEKEEYFSRLQEINRKLESDSEYLSKINMAIPDFGSEPDFINFIKNESSNNSLVLKKVGPIKTSNSSLTIPEKDDLDDIILSAIVSGKYDSFKNFLDKIYESSRLVEVDSIKFSSPQKDVFDFDVTFSARGLK